MYINRRLAVVTVLQKSLFYRPMNCGYRDGKLQSEDKDEYAGYKNFYLPWNFGKSYSNTELEAVFFLWDSMWSLPLLSWLCFVLQDINKYLVLCYLCHARPACSLPTVSPPSPAPPKQDIMDAPTPRVLASD